MLRYRFVPAVLVVGFAAVVSAQAPDPDPMWVANRTSSDLTKVSLGGQSLQTAPMGTNLRRCKVAPDGKIWVIKFIQATFDLRNADGSLFLTVTSALGSPYDVAFDRNGTAWVSGGTGVVNYDANGVLIASYPLPALSPLGITIDADGNKWIAHRIAAPGSVSRIDAVTAAITNHPGPAGSNIQPTNIIADFRGVGVSSHLWVVGDSGTTLLEYDAAGNPLGAYPIAASLGSLATDASGIIWAGSFGNGSVYRFDPTTSTILGSFSVPPAVLGLSFDSFGRLWATVRLASPAASEVRRVDKLTGALEVGSTVGIGTQTALSTRFEQALVVDQLGDADLDGDVNAVEAAFGTSPFDGQSSSATSLLLSGPTALGATCTLTLTTPPTSLSFLAASTSIVPGGIPLPGVTGVLWLDPATILLDPATNGPLILTIPGSFSASFALPGAPVPAGTTFHFQVATTDGVTTRMSNQTCAKLY